MTQMQGASRTPVLTFRAGERDDRLDLEPKRILYPFDFSDAARMPRTATAASSGSSWGARRRRSSAPLHVRCSR